MDVKLTLSVEKQLVEKAKKYARARGRSLSDLVESYFQLLTSGDPDSDMQVSPGIRSLRGALKVPEDYDYKKELSKALTKKYSND